MGLFDDVLEPEAGADPPSSPGLFDDVLAPAPPDQGPTLGDYGKALGAGVAGITEVAGFGLRKLGADALGGELETAGRTVREALTEGIDPSRLKPGVTLPAPFDGMTEAGKAARAAPLVTDDLELGPTPLSTIGLSAVESLPGTVAMGGPGLAAARGLQALKAGEAVTKALGGGKIAKKIGGAVAPGVGFGASEGVFSGAQNAAGIGAQIREASDEQLGQVPFFQEALARTDPGLPLGERTALAREETALSGENEVFGRTALTTGGISAVTGGGAFGQLLNPSGKIVKRTLTGAAQEALQEAPQSATEAIHENLATRDHLDPTRRPGEGVINATALGAASGGLLGALTGAVSPAVAPRLPPPGNQPGGQEPGLGEVQDEPSPARGEGEEGAAEVYERTPNAAAPGEPPPNPPPLRQSSGQASQGGGQESGDDVGLRDLDPAQRRHLLAIRQEGLPAPATGSGSPLAPVGADPRVRPAEGTQPGRRSRAPLSPLGAEMAERARADIAAEQVRIAELASSGPLGRAAARGVESGSLPGGITFGAPPPPGATPAGTGETPGGAQPPGSAPVSGPAQASAQPDLLSATAAPALGPVDQAADQAATSPNNDLPQPTDPQKQAGNFQKGHVRYAGLDISIENPRGSKRSGVDPKGQPWEVEMSAHYGYIRRTEGKDGEQVDVYLASDREDTPAFVVDQADPKTGRFDEHKVVLGAASREEAERVYDAHFSDGSGATRRQAVSELPIEGFKAWLKEGDTNKPVAGRPQGAPLRTPGESRQAPPTRIPTTPAPASPGASAAVDFSPEAHWNGLSQGERVALGQQGGWAKHWAQGFAKKPWAKLSPAARNVIARYVTPDATVTSERAPDAPAHLANPNPEIGSAASPAKPAKARGEAQEDRYRELVRKWGSKSVGKMWKQTTPLEVKVEAERLREALKKPPNSTPSQDGDQTKPPADRVPAAPGGDHENRNPEFRSARSEESIAEPVNVRLRDPEMQAALRHMATQAGWAQRGGELLRDEKDKVIGRTQWLPNEPWYAAIPERLNLAATIEAVRKAIAGEKLGAKERRVVGYMLDAFESEREYEEGRVSAEDREVQSALRREKEEPGVQGRTAFGEVQDEAEREAREERAAIMAEADLALDALPYDDIDTLFAQGEARDLSDEGIDGFVAGETPEGGARAEEADTPRKVDGTAAPGVQTRPGGDALLESYTAEDLAEREQGKLDAERREAEETAAALRKRQADRDREGFVLTGSDLVADELEARGQKSLLDQPAEKQPSSKQPAETAGEGSQATPPGQESDQTTPPPPDLRRNSQAAAKPALSVTYQGRTISVTPPKRLGYNKLVLVDAAKFDAAWAQDKGFYVGPGGTGAAIEGRYQKFEKFIATHDSITASWVDVDAQGRVSFGDGRHRLAVLRDAGLKTLPVAMSKASIKNAEKAGMLASEEAKKRQLAGVPAKAQPAADAAQGLVPGVALAHALRDRILAKPLDRITAPALFKMATEAYGGTAAEGAYTSKDAYDALELGLNLARLKARPNVEGETAERARAILDRFEDSQNRLPTPSKRSGEQMELQQFSTPHTHAHVMTWVANLQPSDVVLEPSAGTGNVVAQALLYGPQSVHANEISERRAELVSELGVPVSRENAAHIDALLPGLTPSVVLMNPPFSANLLMKGKKAVDTGAQHVEAALKKLAPGGRLVALLGRGMGFTETGQPLPRFRAWWGRIQNEYNVRAVYGISGREYRKFGTEFDTALVVIDKTGSTAGPIAHGSVEKVRDLPALLEGIRNDRRTASAQASDARSARNSAESTAGEQGVQKGALGAERGEAGPPSPVRLPVNRVVPAGAETADAERPGRYAGTGRGGDAALEAGAGDGVPHGGRLRSEGEASAERSGDVPDGAGGARDDRDLQAPRQDVGDRAGIPDEGLRRDAISREVEDLSRDTQALDPAAVFEKYRPRIAIQGAKPHPAVLAESAAMASVKAPESTYLPNVPKRLIEEGRLSDAQLVNVIQAGQSHGDFLPNGNRRGYLIGDGTGVGKGAQIAGIILDNWNQGRKRAVWVSENGKLFNDAGRDIEWVGLDKKDLHLHNKFKSEIPLQEGVLFTTYSTVSDEIGGEKDPTGKVVTEPLKRLDQIVKWLGEDFDGVIAFDEAHGMGNSIDEKGDRGIKKASAKALAGVELQKRLPKARVLYVSATAATSVENLAYTDRLGLWGEGTAFANKRDFIDKIKSGGVASMEVVAKDMKAMGLYEARSLSFAGVVQRELLHSLTPDQTETYNEIARAWQLVLHNVNAALKITGADKSAKAKSNALAQFWGSQQRFFNQVLTSLSVPSLIRDAEAQLKSGRSVVMQLVNTNEAVQERRLAQAVEQGIDVGDIDINPRDVLMQYVTNAFPTQLYATTLDEEGNEKSEPVKDSAGNPVEDPEAVRRRDALLEKLASLAVPEGVLEQVVNHFGTKQVAEITGRSRRVVRLKNGETEIEPLSPSKSNKDADAFMQGTKRILVFSDAGGTGRSYHADLKAKNQEKRIHYLVQPGWRADKAVQGLGRTHRTNQKHPPEYVLVTTNLKAQRRFMSSIARRLDQLGALTKGQRDTASQGLFSAEMNLENQYGQWALRSLMVDMFGGRVPGITKQTLEQEMGLYLTDPKTGAVQENKMPTVPRFLNRMLALESETMDRVFDAFYERLEAGIDYARQQGTLDVGMETITAQSVEKVSDQVIAGGQGKAETRYVKLELTDPVRFVQFDQLPWNYHPDIARNRKSGKLYAFVEAPTLTDPETGGLVQRLRRLGVRDQKYLPKREIDGDAYEILTDRPREELRAAWDAEIAKSPQTRTTELHLVTGALLPIWDRLPTDMPKVLRTETDEGERLLGREIPPSDLNATLKALGAQGERPDLSPAQMTRSILSGNATLALVNGWQIAKRRVSGEERIEVMGPTGGDISILKDQGAFTEIIAFRNRVFVPTGTAPEIIERITKSKPVVEILYPRGAKGDSGVRYSYLGEKADKADRGALAEAIALSRLGMSRERIRERTGWFKGRDDRWRFEISDKDARIKDGWRDAKRLGEALEHPLLYANYPGMERLKIRVMDLGPKISAEAYPKSGHIFLSEELSAEEARSALLHEIQHLIQMIERFAMGGNARSEVVQVAALERYTKESEKLTSRLRKLRDLRGAWVTKAVGDGVYPDRTQALEAHDKKFPEAVRSIKRLEEKLDRLDSSTRFEAYQRLMGEVEARDVQARADMSDVERRLAEPYVSQGIKEEDFLIDFADDEVNALEEGPPGVGAPLVGAPLPGRPPFDRAQDRRGAPLPTHQKPGPAGLSVSGVRETLAKRFGGGVGRLIEAGTLRIVQREAELPAHLNDGKGGIRGVYDPKTDTTWMVADNLTAADAPGVFLHELGVHFGLERMVGSDKYQDIIRQMKAMEALGNEAVLAARAAIPKGTSRTAMDDELLGYLVEEHPELPLVKRIIAAIRAFLFRHGLIKNIRPEDVVALAKAATRHAARAAGRAPTRGAPTTAPAYSGSPLWYSEMARFLDDKAPGKAPAGQWKMLLANWAKQGKFKGDELAFSGVNEWLELQQGAVSKAQVLGFIRENGVRVEETTLSDGGAAEQVTAEEVFARSELIPPLNEDSSKWKLKLPDNDVYLVYSREDQGGETNARAQLLLALRRNLQDPQRHQRIARAMSGNIPTKFAQWQLPGGENYRELLLTLPLQTRKPGRIPTFEEWLQEQEWYRAGSVTSEHNQRLLYEQWVERESKTVEPGFRSEHHFDQPNILAHVRFNERTDAEGKRVLFIEEIQSDWAQKGRVKGWRTAGAPSAPFVGKTEAWVALALKRMIRHAAENGFDRIAWTNGEQQAERYDLSKRLDAVHYDEGDVPGTFRISGTKGSKVLIEESKVAPEKLPDVVGKELADKIIEAAKTKERGKFTGIDLRVGGRGMLEFYDKIVPNVANGLLKKLGGGRVDVGRIPLEMPIDGPRMLGYDAWHQREYGSLPGARTPESHFEAYQRYAVDGERASLEEAEVQGFDLTPELQASALRGLALFSKLRDTAVPVPERVFHWLGVAPAKVFADYEALFRKHPDQFSSAEDVKAHVEQVLAEPDHAMPATKEEYTLLVRRNGGDKVAVVEFELRGGKYRVRSAYTFTPGQFERKWEEAVRRWGGTPRVLARTDGSVSSSRPLTASRDTDQPDSRTETIEPAGGPVKGPQAPLYSRAEPPPAPPSQGGERGAPADPNTPEGSAEALGRIGEAMRTTRHGWDAIKSKVLEDWRPAWLGLFTRRQLVDIGQGMVPELANYDRAVQAMDADRNQFDDEAHEVADVAAAYVRANKKEADQLFDLMHAATLAGVDPADRFRASINREEAFAEMASLRRRMRTRSGEADVLQAQIDEIMTRLGNEKVRKHAHPGLARRYWGLSQDAKVVYAKMRDLYKKRFDEREAALIQRIRDAEADERRKARLIADIKHRFETARLSAPYFPLTRFGDYWVAAVNPHGEKEYHLRESAHQQKALLEELERGGYHEIAHGSKMDSLFEQQGASAGFVSNVIKLLDKGMRNSPGAAELKDSIYQMYLQSLPELSARKHWIHRQKTPGFSKDALRGFAKQQFHGNRQLAKLRHQTAMEKALTAARKSVRDADDPNRAAQLVNEMQKRDEWIKNPTTATWANVAGSIGFLWYLTAPASAIVNVTQTPLVAYPLLAARHGWGAAAKALTGATRDYFRGRFSVEGALQGEELAAYRRFLADGVIDKTQSHDLAGMSETPSAIYSGRAAKVMRVLSFLFHRAERMNREVTALAAFRLARAQGLGVDAAYEQAKELSWESHFDYSNSNKARFIQGDVPRVLFMFKQFSQHMTYLLARSAQQSLKGLTPAVRREARVRLTGMLGMHALFAGALGMPLMGTLAMVMNALFDDEDEPYDFELEFRNFLAEAFGPEIGQAIVRGPVESLTKLGVSHRVGLSDLWFREPDKTLEGRGLVEYWTEQFLGPLGGIALKAGTAYDLFQEGHTMRALESMTPTAIRSGLQSLRYYQEGAQSLRGDSVMEDVSTWNVVGQGAGFSPAELGQKYDANRALKDLEQRVLDRRERLINRWWLARRTGDLEGVQEAMDEIGRFNGSSAIRENPRARITPATLLASTQARRRYSRRADDGIIVDQRLARLPERVTFGE